MLSTRLGVSADMPPWAVGLACVLALASLAMLIFEVRRRERGAFLVVATGVLGLLALVAAVLRPARISARESRVGPRVLVLADTSRSMALPGDDGRPRRIARDEAIARLEASGRGARIVVFGFGDGPAVPLAGDAGDASARAPSSDLGAAFRSLSDSADEHPAAVIVVSDGRLNDPSEDTAESAMRAWGHALRVPVHAVATTRLVPKDASVRRVSAAGAAVAHVPLPLRVEVGCEGLTCDAIPVTARELRDDGPPNLLASGVANARDGKASLDLAVTLEQAGSRIVEVAITPPEGDTIPANDRRLVTFQVKRERVRVLHIAGRPTNDVRALRQWLKSDAAVDVVAYFI
jgi:hypothetical protein